MRTLRLILLLLVLLSLGYYTKETIGFDSKKNEITAIKIPAKTEPIKLLFKGLIGTEEKVLILLEDTEGNGYVIPDKSMVADREYIYLGGDSVLMRDLRTKKVATLHLY